MPLLTRRKPPQPARVLNPGRSSRNALRSDPALTASGERVKRDSAVKLQRLGQPWQMRALQLYDELGEVHYAAQFYARMLTPLRLYVAKRDAQGELVEIDAATATGDDQAAVEALNRLEDPSGGRSGILAQYGRLMFLIGDSFLVSTTKDKEERWEVLSPRELRVNALGGYSRFRAPSLPPEDLKDPPDDAFEPLDEKSAVVYRLWRRHPTYSEWADSSMQAVIEICVAEGSLVNTLRGPVPIEEVTTDDSVLTWEPEGINVRPVVRHLNRGDQPIVKVVAGRRTLRATADHPVLVLRKDRPGKGRHARYECEWVGAGEIERGDHLVVLDHAPDYGIIQEMPDGTPIFEDVAWLLGQIVGDGCVTGAGVDVATFHATRASRVCEIVRENWGLEAHPQGGSVRFFSRALRRALERMGLRVKAHRKRVPAEILASPPWVKRAFLSGYEAADGHLTKQGWQSLALSSPTLAQELRALYLELGENVSNIHIETRAAVMAMPGGFSTENAKPLHRFQVYYGSRRHGALGVLRAEGAQEAIGGEHFTLATVKSVAQAGSCRTYDLEVEGAHNYIADGVVSHNCEELLLLSRAVRSRTRSRLAGAGILLITADLTVIPLEPVPDEDPEEDPFVSELVHAFTTPIQDEGSANAVVPLVVRVPEGVDVTKAMVHIQVTDPTQLYPETGLRREAIDRLATGFDMPPEILTGTGDVNHWGAWQIGEDTWRGHGQPVAQGLVDDLTSSYLRPTLRQEGVKDPKVYAVAYDAAAVVTHPDRGKDAKDVWDRGGLSLKALRDSTGFDDDDAPPEQDRAERIGIATRDSSLAWYGIPSVRAGGIEPEPGVVEQAGQPPTGTPVTGPPQGAEVEKGPPSSGPPESSETVPGEVVGSGNGSGAHYLGLVLGACTAGLFRAREAAGNRAVAHAKKDEDAAGLVKGVATGQACARLGEARLRALRAPEGQALVAGSAALLEAALRSLRVPRDVARQVSVRVEQHAARTLYDEQATLPASFAGYVQGLLAVKA